MKYAIVAITIASVFGSSMALAQNAGTGSTTSTDDAAISPAISNPVNASSDNRPSPGAGVASGALNNGTTGDTIGTGHGTPPAPTTGAVTTK